MDRMTGGVIIAVSAMAMIGIFYLCMSLVDSRVLAMRSCTRGWSDKAHQVACAEAIWGADSRIAR